MCMYLYVMFVCVYPVHIYIGRWTVVVCVYTQMHIRSKYRRPRSPRPCSLPLSPPAAGSTAEAHTRSVHDRSLL